jgi:cytochrome c oxidase subunit IV
MTDTHEEPNYMKVFAWLIALTVIEVGIVYMHMPKAVLVTALILLALAKAFLVAWYFMHLRNEKVALIAMVGLPLLLLADLFLGLMPDVARRLF